MKVLARCLMVAAVVAAMMLPAGAANAAGAGVCNIQGTVTLGAPLNSTPRPSTYTFVDTTLDCTGTADINGVWNTSANGATKGILSSGETCEEGASNGPGSVFATSSGGRAISGSVTFVRVGVVVEANGAFVSNTTPPKTYTWAGAFLFVPIPATAATLCTSAGPGGVTAASLTGEVAVATTQ